MFEVGFDCEKYLKMQSEHILERIGEFGNKLYLEFGGKLFDDWHASRVLPGFVPDIKIQLLSELKDNAEIVVVISAIDIEGNKIRQDLGITYDIDVLRLIDAFRSRDLYVGSVVITQYNGQPSADNFKKRLETLGIKCYIHYPIAGYPTNIPFIVSDEGYGKNDFIETTKPLVVITAPGPGSGKMATCLSQIYNDHKRGIKSGYAKFETFPIWNLPLSHPVNIAYEAATVDLKDANMIDPFHLEAYSETTVNYNRDIEVFPVLNAMFTKIYGKSPYKSPTDMGVNMAGHCISNDEACKTAARQEIIRRYYAEACLHRQGLSSEDSVYKAELLINQANATLEDREVAIKADELAFNTASPAVCLKLNDGTLISGKTSDLFGPCAAALLNAIKHLAGIPKDVHILSPIIVEPIQQVKTKTLGGTNPRLHTDEVLIALAMSAATNPVAKAALDQVEKLRGAEGHSSVILSGVDANVCKKIGINMSCSAKYETEKLYHK